MKFIVKINNVVFRILCFKANVTRRGAYLWTEGFCYGLSALSEDVFEFDDYDVHESMKIKDAYLYEIIPF